MASVHRNKYSSLVHWCYLQCLSVTMSQVSCSLGRLLSSHLTEEQIAPARKALQVGEWVTHILVLEGFVIQKVFQKMLKTTIAYYCPRWEEEIKFSFGFTKCLTSKVQSEKLSVKNNLNTKWNICNTIFTNRSEKDLQHCSHSKFTTDILIVQYMQSII